MSQKRISKNSQSTRLFSRDESHIKRMVKTEGPTNTQYSNFTAAMRHYVMLGIATEKRTEGLTSLETHIVKTSQKEVAFETLLPLKKSIDKLSDNIDSLKEENQATKRGLFDVLMLLKPLSVLVQKSLHNILLLRAVVYVFSLGYKSHDISSFTTADWRKLVLEINNKAIDLTEPELTQTAKKDTDITLLNKLIRDAFTLVKQSKKST